MRRERRGQLLRHMGHGGLAGGVSEAGRGTAVETADARGGDHLAVLRHVGGEVPCGEEGEESQHAEEGATDVDAQGVAEGRGVPCLPDAGLGFDECAGGGERGWEGFRDAGVGKEEVDETGRGSYIGGDAVEVVF